MKLIRYRLSAVLFVIFDVGGLLPLHSDYFAERLAKVFTWIAQKISLMI
jgi:hypothetical protein